MKKALQVVHFRANLSLPDGAAGIGPCEACARSFFHRFAKFLGADRRRPGARLADVLRGGLEWPRWTSLGGRRRGLRKWPRSEPEPLRRGLAEHLAQPRQDLALELAELESPDRRARGNVERPVSPDARRPRVRGD